MRTSQSQFLIMIEYMERYGDLSKPTAGPHGRQRNLERWKELTQKLNSDGSGDPRSEEKWRKVWSDYKNNAKKKAAKISRGMRGTGGGPAQKIWLTDLEERVMSLIGEQAATGIPTIPEAGFAKAAVPSNEEDATIVIIAADDQTQPVEEYECQNKEFQPELEYDHIDQIIGDEDWNKPGSSSDPHSQPPEPRPKRASSNTTSQHRDHPSKTSPSTTTKWDPPKKKARKLDQATEAFLECEKGRDEKYFEMERERIRQRDTELQLQAQWQEIMKLALKLLEKYLDKNA